MNRISRAMKRAFRKDLPKPASFLVAPHHNAILDLLPENADGLSVAGPVVPTIISFGTRDGVYDAFAARLEKSCRTVEHNVAIQTLPAMSAQNAFSLKPTFIKWQLLTLGQPVIWIDSDAILSAPIVLPEGVWDIGTLRNNHTEPRNPIASLCIAFRPTVAALRFLEHWEQFCAAHWLKPGEDHRRLNYTRFILEGHFTEIDISQAVKGKLIRDFGRAKEHAF